MFGSRRVARRTSRRTARRVSRRRFEKRATDKWGPIAGFPDDRTPKAVSPTAVAGFGNH